MKGNEYVEGSDAFVRFDRVVTSVLAVPRATLVERARDYQKQSALNTKRRGPKRRPSAFPAPADAR